MKSKQVPELPEPMSKEEMLKMQYDSAPKMVKVGSLYGCVIWAEIDQHRHPQDRWRVYQLIMNFFRKATGMPE